MKSFKLILLLLILNAFDLCKKTNAVSATKNNTATELSKDLGKVLDQLNVTNASYVAKIRNITPSDNDSFERKLKIEANSTENKTVSTTTTTAFPLNVSTIWTDAGPLQIINVLKNSTKDIVSTKSDKALQNHTNEVEKLDKNNNSTNKVSSAFSTTATIKPLISTNNTVIGTVNATASATNNNSSINTSPNISSSSSSTTSTTTTTTTTPKPKKPTITYSVLDFPDLEKDNPELKNLLQTPASNKAPLPDVPYAQPSQEYNGSLHRGRDFILPIVSMIFIIPLVIGILITSYRRFRDCWSTRHYRRMDFLVDGMYND